MYGIIDCVARVEKFQRQGLLLLITRLKYKEKKNKNRLQFESSKITKVVLCARSSKYFHQKNYLKIVQVKHHKQVKFAIFWKTFIKIDLFLVRYKNKKYSN